MIQDLNSNDTRDWFFDKIETELKIKEEDKQLFRQSLLFVGDTFGPKGVNSFIEIFFEDKGLDYHKFKMEVSLDYLINKSEIDGRGSTKQNNQGNLFTRD